RAVIARSRGRYRTAVSDGSNGWSPDGRSRGPTSPAPGRRHVGLATQAPDLPHGEQNRRGYDHADESVERRADQPVRVERCDHVHGEEGEGIPAEEKPRGS